MALYLEPGQRCQTKRPGNAVAEHERHRAEGRAPDDPAQLTASGDRSHAAERARHDQQTADQAEREIQQLAALDHRDHVREHCAVLADAQDRRDSCPAEQHRGHVEQRQQRARVLAARPAAGTLGEHQREVHEERRQQQHRHDIAPVEDGVEQIEAAAEREREDAEERDREPEEVQRRLILWTAQTNTGADGEREESNRGECVVKASRTGRNRFDGDGDHRFRLLLLHQVGQLLALCSCVQSHHHLIRRIDRDVVHRQHRITGLETGAVSRRPFGNFGGHDVAGAEVAPEHPVLHLAPTAAGRDVQDGEAHQRCGNHDGSRDANERSEAAHSRLDRGRRQGDVPPRLKAKRVPRIHRDGSR